MDKFILLGKVSTETLGAGQRSTDGGGSNGCTAASLGTSAC